MRADLLNLVAARLESLPETHFDLGMWRSECGTVGCAIGHAVLIPEVAATGLSCAPGGAPCRPAPGFPLSHDWGYSAAAAAFEIPYDSASYLFSPDEYDDSDRTPAESVAARIRAFVESGGVVPDTEDEE